MLPVVFHPLAAAELDHAVTYLEAIRPGKGLEFADCVEASIALICRHPEAGPVSRASVRSKGVGPRSRWRYTIYYRIRPHEIRVLAIAHHRRQPFYWFGRR